MIRVIISTHKMRPHFVPSRRFLSSRQFLSIHRNCNRVNLVVISPWRIMGFTDKSDSAGFHFAVRIGYTGTDVELDMLASCSRFAHELLFEDPR